jgi:hypothetical protein
MRKVLSGHATYFNKRHRRVGFLFQNRYKSILCQEDAYLLELVRYIHLNPVRAGFVEDIHKLDRYPWCGHSAIIGRHPRDFQSVDEVLSCFGNKKKHALSRYRQFIEDGWNMGRRDDLTGGGLLRSAGGWIGIQKLKKQKSYWRRDERILGDGDFVSRVLDQAEEELDLKEQSDRSGLNIQTLTKRVCDIYELQASDVMMKGRNNKISEAKCLIMFLASKHLGMRGTVIAKYFNCRQQSVSRNIRLGEHYSRKIELKLLN